MVSVTYKRQNDSKPISSIIPVSFNQFKRMIFETVRRRIVLVSIVTKIPYDVYYLIFFVINITIIYLAIVFTCPFIDPVLEYNLVRK